jgi:hypothetical protein
MTVERKIAKAFRLTDESWMKHANPWSVWTRYSVLPLIVLAFWSRVWIGWWCLVPGIISLLWMFFNPVFFNKPRPTKRAPDSGESGTIPSIFLRLSIFQVGRRSAARPSAGNANR